MDKNTRHMLELTIKGIEKEETYQKYRGRIEYAEGFINALQWAEKISEKEALEMKELTGKASKAYWDKAKADFKSAHKRIF